MATAIATDIVQSNIKQTFYLSGDATTEKDIAWVDMKDYDNILICAGAAALTGVGVTVFKIIANSESDGSGTDVEIKAHAVGSAPDAAGDYLFLEASAEEIGAASTTASGQLRYVSAAIDAANAADEIAVIYTRTNPKFAHDGLTVDYVS